MPLFMIKRMHLIMNWLNLQINQNNPYFEKTKLEVKPEEQKIMRKNFHSP